MFGIGYEPWKDVLVFNFASYSYVLQGRKHKRTLRTDFRISKCGGVVAAAHHVTKEQLIESGLWISNQNI